VALGEWLRELCAAHADASNARNGVARAMLEKRPDTGAEAFMAARMGLGMFVKDVASGDAARPDRWMLHQAANDGFRGLFLVRFDGANAQAGPLGFVLLVNGDNDGMLACCEIARECLAALGVDGFAGASAPAAFSTAGLKQEEIINLGFKGLVLDHFAPAP